jgi:type 1 glutamine amidotransferase
VTTRNLLLTGGPGHDFDTTAAALVELLGEVGVGSTVLTDPDELVAAIRSDPPDLVTVAALRWSMAQPAYADLAPELGYRLADDDAALLDGFVRAGGGLLALHTAVICFDAHPTWRELCGAAWDWSRSSHPPAGPAEVRVSPLGRDHVVTAGIDDFVVDDEVYGLLDEVEGIRPLLTSDHGGRSHPVLWARQVGDGRVVTDLLGHAPGSLAHPVHRTILGRAARWATGVLA